RVAEKAMEMRKQGFFGPAMLPYSELEYGGIVARMERLENEFIVRESEPVATPSPGR
ncbi:MAG: fructose 1,6-bisphosphatase, partial [Armatimonadota bacterium]|nr:fructose 1,6-bisphosphatase [Armatimonadota bacterium]